MSSPRPCSGQRLMAHGAQGDVGMFTSENRGVWTPHSFPWL